MVVLKGAPSSPPTPTSSHDTVLAATPNFSKIQVTHHITVFISKLQVFHITQDLFINLRPRLSRGRLSMLSMAMGVSVVMLVVSVPSMAQVRYVVHRPAIAVLCMVAVSGVSHARCSWAVGIVIHRGTLAD